MARIFVIDDQPSIRRAVRRVLERAGHEVTEAAEGHTALRHFAGNPTDLVITDVFMPEMDGIEFLVRVQEAFPEARIVVISGGGALPKEDVLEDAKGLGAVATLSKPFTPQELLDVAEAALAMDPPGPEGSNGGQE